ncbi:MAG TPA: PQQ-dependent sugar dehydrogenase [Phycisphaerae bacterium]|nr:PQQ-dependent sugar dehydrogenase [Phycisphaerae bacterium]
MNLRTAVALLLTALALPACADDEALPAGFAVTEYATGLDQPVALAFAPDGRLFIAQRTGDIRVVENGILRAVPFATFDVYTVGEGGLLGLAVSPDFAETGYVFAFITRTGEEQQIVRVTDVGGLGGDPVVIRDNLPTNGSNHNGGCLRFGPDGALYFAIGDNGVSENAQQLTTFAGKLCRINPDGSVPADNPLVTPTDTPRAIYALGFRNPFRFCFAPDGRLFLNDVGSSGDGRREEINLVTAGGNYGWPEVEGVAPAGAPADFIDPILTYHDEGSSIAGCAYYATGQFPPAYHDTYFHLDYVSQQLYNVPLDGDTALSHDLFAQLDGGPVDLLAGPDGALYYTEIYAGRVMRISYPANDAPAPTPTPAPGPTATPTPTATPDPGDTLDPSPCGAGATSALLVVWGTFLAVGRVGRCARVHSDAGLPLPAESR